MSLPFELACVNPRGSRESYLQSEKAKKKKLSVFTFVLPHEQIRTQEKTLSIIYNPCIQQMINKISPFQPISWQTRPTTCGWPTREATGTRARIELSTQTTSNSGTSGLESTVKRYQYLSIRVIIIMLSFKRCSLQNSLQKGRLLENRYRLEQTKFWSVSKIIWLVTNLIMWRETSNFSKWFSTSLLKPSHELW